jgi:hypothetical protein
MSVKNKTHDVRYLTHMIVFPDDDAFIEQKPFIHDLQFECDNWEHLPPFNTPGVNGKELIKTLLKKGEAKFQTPYPHGGNLDHVLSIDDHQRVCGWFGSNKH